MFEFKYSGIGDSVERILEQLVIGTKFNLDGIECTLTDKDRYSKSKSSYIYYRYVHDGAFKHGKFNAAELIDDFNATMYDNIR